MRGSLAPHRLRVHPIAAMICAMRGSPGLHRSGRATMSPKSIGPSRFFGYSISDEVSYRVKLVDCRYADYRINELGGELDSTGLLEVRVACRGWSEGHVKI